MLQAENSYDCASTSARESSRVSSRLLTPSLGSNRTNGSSSGGSKSSVVHEPARAESRPGLEPPRNRQEPPRGSSLEFELARGPLSEPARVAKGLESARPPLFEPPRAGCQETRADSSRVQSWARAGSGSWHPRARVRSARAQH